MGVVSVDSRFYQYIFLGNSMQRDGKKEGWWMLDDVPSVSFAPDLPSILHDSIIIEILARRVES